MYNREIICPRQARSVVRNEFSRLKGVVYSTIATYDRRSEISMVDFTAIYKLAPAFDVMIEDLVEIIEE